MKKKSIPVGRPSQYKPEYCSMLIEHFSKDPYEIKLVKKVTKSGDVIEENIIIPSDFPTLASFAIELGVSRDTLYEWSKVHKEFSYAYNRGKDFQERYLTINGLKGLLQGNFAIFTAKNVIDWRDKTEIETNQNIQAKVEMTDDQKQTQIESAKIAKEYILKKSKK